MVQLREHFASNEHGRHSDWLRQQRWFIKSRRELEKKQEASEKLDDDILDAATSAVLATKTEIAEFEAKLDAYDEATVKALMENQALLETVNTQILVMLDRAYVMDDGRRVFKTEDGTQVFDEFGIEVTSEELDFREISSNRPTWEAFAQAISRRNDLESERGDILEFQDKLDSAREAASQDGLTTDELEEMDAELADLLPVSVAEQMPGFENSETGLAQQTGLDITNGTKAIVETTVQITPKFDPMG